MNEEKDAKAALDFLHVMRKIETLPLTTQEELNAIKDGILNMAHDAPEGFYMVETSELPDEHRYGEDALKILYREEQAKQKLKRIDPSAKDLEYLESSEKLNRLSWFGPRSRDVLIAQVKAFCPDFDPAKELKPASYNEQCWQLCSICDELKRKHEQST